MTPGEATGLAKLAVQYPPSPPIDMRDAFLSNMSDNHVNVCNNVIEYAPDAPCPCCNRSLRPIDDRMTLDEPKRSPKLFISPYNEKPSLFSTMADRDDDDGEFDNDLLPGTLSTGLEYTPTTMLVEGWVHKKGTGNDWLRSTSWKARYAKLVLAKVDGCIAEVPLLLIYWFQLSDTPSTVISLDSTVVIPIDKQDKSKWNSFQWNVIHARDEQQCTRTFTAPEKGRNAWVLKMNEALMAYEKAKSLEKKQQDHLLILKHRSISLDFASEDRFEVPNRTSFSPPSSPRPAERRPLPRPEKLKGEGLLP